MIGSNDWQLRVWARSAAEADRVSTQSLDTEEQVTNPHVQNNETLNSGHRSAYHYIDPICSSIRRYIVVLRVSYTDIGV